MAPGEHEFELAGSGFAEHGDRTFSHAAFSVVGFHLVKHLLRILFAVQAEEDLLDHLLLIFIEGFENPIGHDPPVVIHPVSQFMVPGKGDLFALLVRQAFEERGCEGLGVGRFRCEQRSRGAEEGPRGGGFDEGAPVVGFVCIHR